MIAKTEKTEFETTFNDAAEDYEASRPAYCPQLYRDLLTYQPIDSQSCVLEIGMGTGKATGPVLETQCRLIALEPGDALARAAQRKFRQHKNLSIEVKAFQDYDCEAGTFDLIYAATAFHWIPEAYGYRRVFELLKEGGAFARFAYRAGEDQTRPEMSAEIRRAYERCPTMSQRKRPDATAEARRLSQLAGQYGFADLADKTYHWTKDFTADGYMQLLSTYPDHMALPQEEREMLFSDIHHAIEKHGGMITVHYTADMQLARKPKRGEMKHAD